MVMRPDLPPPLGTTVRYLHDDTGTGTVVGYLDDGWITVRLPDGELTDWSPREYEVVR